MWFLFGVMNWCVIIDFCAGSIRRMGWKYESVSLSLFSGSLRSSL